MVSAPATAVELNAPRRRSPGGWAFVWGTVLLLLAGLGTYLILGSAAADFQTVDQKRALERAKILADRLSDDQKILHDNPSWINKDKGLVRVPIERAMTMTIAELSQVQPHPAYPISQSPPQPASALLNYGTQFPGKTTKAATPALPTGAQPAGAPAPPPASALPAATPVPPSPDAAASIGKSSPAPAPVLVAPPAPSAAPSATAPAASAPTAPAAPAPANPAPAPSPAATTPAP